MSNGTGLKYAEIYSEIVDPHATTGKDGKIGFKVNCLDTDTEVMTIKASGDDASGFVGIGIASPTVPLHLSSAVAGSSGLGATYVRIATTTDSGRNLHINLTDDSYWVVDSGTYGIKLNTGTANEGVNISAAGEVTMPTQPAFSVKPSGSQADIAHGSQVTILWGTETFDIGSNFASNTFTAPVTGKYQLQATIRMDQMDTGPDYYQITLVTSNRSYPSVFLLDPGVLASDPAYWSGTFAILADMDASDTASITFYQHDGGTNNQTDIQDDSFFSGYLVC